MEVYVLHGEMLNFVRSIPDGYGGNFLLSGLEERFYDKKTQAYVYSILTELHRVMMPGDAIMISGPSFEIIKGNAVLRRQEQIKDNAGKVLFEHVNMPGGLKITDNAIYKRV